MTARLSKIAICAGAAVVAAALLCQGATPAVAASCSATLGAAKAKILVDRCLDVSPATHPPCNASNSCDLIISEIRRSCALLGDQAPKYCAEYK